MPLYAKWMAAAVACALFMLSGWLCVASADILARCSASSGVCAYSAMGVMRRAGVLSGVSMVAWFVLSSHSSKGRVYPASWYLCAHLRRYAMSISAACSLSSMSHSATASVCTVLPVGCAPVGIYSEGVPAFSARLVRWAAIMSLAMMLSIICGVIISETVQFLMAEQSLIFLFGLLFYAFDEAFYCAFDVVGYFLYLFFGGFYCAFGE